MDTTLTANLCPFRSPSWDTLPNQPASIAFSKELWGQLLDFAAPRVVVCIGVEPMRHLGAVLESRGARLRGPPENGPVGWEPQTYSIADYESPTARTRLVRVPHLSRFAIVGRAASAAAVTRITTAIAGGLTGTEPTG